MGGVLVGNDLISAARIRSQITQIDQYNAAVNTFKLKYNCLPGDCKNAAQFGFPARGQYLGQGDGDGVLEGIWQPNVNINWNHHGAKHGAGETVTFWVDLSIAGLIASSFNTATSNSPPNADITGTDIGKYFPTADIKQNAYVYVWSSGHRDTVTGGIQSTGTNYYGVSRVTGIPVVSSYADTQAAPGLTVQQAYNIDSKVDDGNPQAGKVTAAYPLNWTNGTWILNSDGSLNLGTAAIVGSSSTCFDNGGNSSNPMRYSLTFNAGREMSCTLSFQFQ